MTDLIRFEWRYHTRQMSFPAAALLFFAFGFALAATGFGPSNVRIDSPFSIAQSMGVLSLMSLFVLAVFASSAMIRDREYRFEEIVFATGLTRSEFLTSRFAGAFLAAITSFMFSIAGLMAGRLAPGHDPVRVGTFDLLSYLWPMLMIVVPNLLFLTVVLFAIAALTRSLLAGAVGAVVIYVLYFAVAAWTNSPLMAASVPGIRDGFPFAALFDPFGLSAFFEQTRHWTPATRNVRRIELGGMFLANRVLWLAVTAGGWLLLHRLFSFRTKSSASAKKVESEVLAPTESITFAAVQPESSIAAAFRGFTSATWIEIRSYVASLPFLALIGLWAALAFSEMASSLTNNEYGSDLLPTSGLVMAAVQPALQVMGLIVIIYYSAEMVWRERVLRMDGIMNATPASSATFVLSKWVALSALTAVLVLTASAVGIVFQLTHGFSGIDAPVLGAYAWFAGAPLLVFGMAAVFVHVVSPHKYLGLLVVLMLGLTRSGELTGLEHHLWRFGSTPDVLRSDLYGFGPFTAPFNWYVLHWLIAGSLLLLVSSFWWRRGAPRGSRSGRSPARGAVAAAALLVAFAASTLHILYNTHVLNQYVNSDALIAWKAEYEGTWGGFETTPQPGITSIHSRVDLHPAERRYRVAGSYSLINHHQAPIEVVLVSLRRSARDVSVTLAGQDPARTDPRFGHYVFPLRDPLPPGDSIELRFDATYGDIGFSEAGPDTSIVENGTWIPSFRAFPMIGYRSSYELTDVSSRRRAGLPDRQEAGPADEEGRSRARVDITISTPADQIPITSGDLAAEWISDGRRHRRYTSSNALAQGVVIASGRYATASTAVGDRRVDLYYHPPHGANAERMLRAASESIRSFEAAFGPYPYSHLKIVEAPAPRNSFGGFARPDTIFIGESRGFLTDMRKPVPLDLPTRRIAHEVAHQWWGVDLTPLPGPGASFLAESLTKYSELLVLERLEGPTAVAESLAHELDAYLEGRTRDEVAEKPLSKVLDEDYLYYRKGAIVTRGLRDLLGERRFHAALSTFYDRFRGGERSPVISDFIAIVEREATPAERALIREWLQGVVLYDIGMEDASASRLPDGRHEVRLRISARKFDAHDRDIPVREELAVAIYREDDEANPLYLARHPILSGDNEIVVVVKGEPSLAAVDPGITRLDINRFDNTEAVDVGAR